jgi:predicted GNAT family acetyltransferase
MPEKTIAHARERCRYELRLDDEVVAVADYRDADGARAFTHTETGREHRGKGLAAEVVEFALRDTQEAGLQALPLCWYVRDYLGGHPELGTLDRDSSGRSARP